VRKPARLPLEVLAPYLLEMATPGEPGALATGFSQPPVTHAPASPEIVNWTSIFGNDRPVEVEVGCGKGPFLVSAGQAHAETNFLGIEVLRGLQLYVATRLAKRNARNVRVACTDARRFFRERVPTASVQAVHVYFPDPWWKKRHRKRRVWTPEFAADCERVLWPGGRLHAATDVADYYQVIRDLLDRRPGLRLVTESERSGPPAPDEALTNFERKARQKGGSVYRAEYERTPG
jgi:tRNA (guanine-N7-)-methyltransferase